MKEQILKYWDMLVAYFKPKEVQPLSAENAQSLSFFRKKLSYEEMVSTFKKELFSDIKNVSFSGHSYIDIVIPEWVKEDTYNDLIKELISLGYCTREIKELDLVIIYWNSK